MTIGGGFLLTSLAVVLLVGCVPVPPITVSGLPLPQEAVARIEPRETKKTQILEWFGPPTAIVAKGDRLPITGDQTEAASFFELFSSKHTISDYHRVYYYYHAVMKKQAVVLAVYIHEKTSINIDKLWVLVNEETGIVEDYVFRRSQ